MATTMEEVFLTPDGKYDVEAIGFNVDDQGGVTLYTPDGERGVSLCISSTLALALAHEILNRLDTTMKPLHNLALVD